MFAAETIRDVCRQVIDPKPPLRPGILPGFHLGGHPAPMLDQATGVNLSEYILLEGRIKSGEITPCG